MVYNHPSLPRRPPRPPYLRLWPDTFLSTDVSTLNDQTAYTVLTDASVRRLNQ